jgi:hypothetical protein
MQQDFYQIGKFPQKNVSMLVGVVPPRLPRTSDGFLLGWVSPQRDHPYEDRMV